MRASISKAVHGAFMKPVGLLMATMLVACCIFPTRAQAPTSAANAPVYVIGYLDVIVPAKAQAMALLKQFRRGCAREDGNLRCEAVQRMEQQNEFAILEVWKDQKAYQAHVAGPGMLMRGRLKPLLASPYDERVHTALSAQAPQPTPPGRVVYAIGHLDANPAQTANAVDLLTRMTAAGRKDRGNSRLEALQQLAPLSNHFTVVEIWGNKRLLEAHQAAPPTIRFRDRLQPILDAPYDERLYKILD